MKEKGKEKECVWEDKTVRREQVCLNDTTNSTDSLGQITKDRFSSQSLTNFVNYFAKKGSWFQKHFPPKRRAQW